MTEVMPNLFIGHWMDARDVRHPGSAFHVVTVAHDSPVTGDAKFDLVDGPGCDPEAIEAAAAHVAEAHRAGKRVLVHCHGGRSRSGIVTVLAMALITGRQFFECYDALMNSHGGLIWSRSTLRQRMI